MMLRWSCVLLAMLGACAGPRVEVGPRAPAVAAARPLAAAPPRFVELRGGTKLMCGRTAEGALYCWGSVPRPGAEGLEIHAVPTRLDGLPPLAGFTIAGQQLVVGWDAGGQVALIARDPYDGRSTTLAVQRQLPVRAERVTTEGGVTVYPAPRPVTPAPIVEARGPCIRTADNRAYCSGASPVDALLAFSAHDLAVSKLGEGPCMIDAAGVAVAVQGPRTGAVSLASGVAIPEYGSAPLGLGPAREVACFYRHDDDPYTARAWIEGCALDATNTLRCTSPALQAEMDGLREGRAVVALSAPSFRGGLCLVRDDGQARCRTSDPDHVPLVAALASVDASAGLGHTYGVLCALGRDGTPRCWGERDNPALGDGAQPALRAPVHMAAYDGGDTIASEGGVTCVGHGGTQLRCFGGVLTARVDTQPFTSPEPFDQMVGGFPLCVRGTTSKGWYCRDPLATYFKGTLAGGFEALRDGRGRLLGDAVRSLAADSGVGIQIVRADGSRLTFEFRHEPKPLRLVPWKIPPAQRVFAVGTYIDLAGNGVLRARGTRPERTVPGPLRKLASPCALDEAGRVSCYPDTADPAAAPTVVATGAVDITDDLAVLLPGGAVLRPTRRDDPTAGFAEIAGLPPMRAVAGSCGLSTTNQVWCWGKLADLDEPMHRLTPAPVTAAPPPR